MQTGEHCLGKPRPGRVRERPGERHELTDGTHPASPSSFFLFRSPSGSLRLRLDSAGSRHDEELRLDLALAATQENGRGRRAAQPRATLESCSAASAAVSHGATLGVVWLWWSFKSRQTTATSERRRGELSRMKIK